MRGTIWVLVAGTLVLVLAAGAALAAQQGGGESGKEKTASKGSTDAESGDGRATEGQTLEFEGRPTSVNGYVDLGQQGATPGDLFIFSDELYRTDGRSEDGGSDGQDSSEKVGQADGRCTLIDPSSERFMCTVISSFENGTVVTEGLLTNNQDSPSPAGVTSGTGDYRGMTGEASLDLAPAQGPHAIRFELQRPNDGSAPRPDREETVQQQQQKEKTREGTQAKADDAKNDSADRESTDKVKAGNR